MRPAELSHRPAPSRAQEPTPIPIPIEVKAPGVEVFGASPRRFSIGTAGRALRRHWWQAFLLWSIGSAGLMALAYARVKPSYDASSTIRVEPGERVNSGDFEVFKETQARRVLNPNVVASALAAHPELLRFSRLAQAPDPEGEVRRAVSSVVLPRTNLIQVSMTSESAEEAASIVNALIEAYLKVAIDDHPEEEAEARRRKLGQVRQERAVDVARKREAVAALVRRIGTADGRQARDRNAVTIEQYAVVSRQILQADLGLVEAQALVEQRRSVPALPTSEGSDGPDPEMVAAFYADPQVSEVRNRLDKARGDLAQADRIARNPGEPGRIAAQKKVDEANRQIDALWARMRPALEQAGRAGAAREADHRADELKEAEAKVLGLKTRMAQLNDRLEKLNEQSRAAGGDELALEFARQDLNRAESVLDSVTKGLDQVELEGKTPVARFLQEYRAKASGSPDVNHRGRLLAAAPVGMFLVVLALMALVESRSGRVHDPDEVPDRLRLPVLGVVPVLPRSRPAHASSSTDKKQDRSRRDHDQFVQSVDHLRVTLSAGADAWGRPRRTFLITSACSGEGKTTLAAQLAERSVNAGLLTLLIDADVRNPTLSRMFDRASARGLSDVLEGEAMAEEAISIVGGAGGFHFLPSGSARVDPSRLLQTDRLAKLLASARESFDMVIVDGPPVLPVPDALTIGRWVDGAVLAVRFDASRFPMVDRANRRLAAVGVPVIGAVINGVRGSAGGYYGAEASSYATRLDPDGDSHFAG